MKKIVLILLAITALFACSKEISKEEVGFDIDNLTEGQYVFTITASVEDLTKTSYAGETDFSWDAHDKISVLFHNGETHKFYPLETVSGADHGKSAVFRGVIDSGYEVGASDTEGGVKWALYPAGNHTWNTTNHRPNFVIPNVTDFTTADHISSNIPLYAQGDGSSYTFSPLAGAYKITFTDIDASKVRFIVTHNQTHQLSGTFPISTDETNYYWWAQYASVGSANQSIAIIKDVVTKSATFYFFCGIKDEGAFQPTVTLKDETTGYTIYRGTAKTAWSSDALKPIANRIVVLPSIPAPGEGTPFISSYGINWLSASGVAGSTAPGNDAVKRLKYSATSSKLYLYFELDETKLYNDPSYKYGNHWYMYFGDGSGEISSQWKESCDGKFEGWIKIANAYNFDYWGSSGTTFSGIERYYTSVDGTVFVEMAIDRSKATYLQGTSCQFGLCLTSRYIDSKDVWLGSDSTIIGIAPVGGGSMMSMTLPTYVAP
ncbi:MAG: hypothetical protein IK052_00930 [Bacteroidales bacterium]|nr:hypothetical protein [Bacteroidales bacterium]